VRAVWTQTFSLPPEIPYASTGICRGPVSCLTIGIIGSRCVHRRVGVCLWTCPHLWTGLQTYAHMHSNVLTRERFCVCSQTRSRKRPCLHISAVLSVPFPITLPGERWEGRGEELTVTRVPRTSSGPIWQWKLDVCVHAISVKQQLGKPTTEQVLLAYLHAELGLIYHFWEIGRLISSRV